MTDRSAALSAPQYRLRTFGSLSLLGTDDETVLGKHGHHRRRLALLAVLAAAGEQGRSRDALLLLFWPEATQTRARHSLDQLLYALRGSIGETVFTDVNPVRLNARIVASDVGAFNSAVEGCDFEAAVEEFRGPFLDGFYLGDAPEFEHWVESERARLAGRYRESLERLARSAEAARDHAAAVRWWRKLVEADPVSSVNATGLIRALTNAGDHASALQYAERYETVVARELGTSVGPAVAGLVAEVRAEARTEPVALAKSPPLPRETPLAAPDVSRVARQPLRRRPRRAVAYLIASLVAALAMITTAAWLNGRADEESIAVLPFANLAPDQQDAAIADGLSEELMAALWGIPNLRVIARNSAFAFRNSNVDARRIGDSLGVNHLLEGSFRRSGSRLRVQVRLVDTRDASTRWSNTYDKEFTDIFTVQTEIATSVSRELGLRLGKGETQSLRRPLTRNIAAYELYLRGRDPVHQRTDSGPHIGLALLTQAVALDSTFAAAYAHIPYMYFNMVLEAKTRAEADEMRRLARAAAEKALSLDPSLPEAHRGLAVALTLGLFDLPAAEAALRRALALGGAPRVHEHLGRILAWMGRYEEAFEETLRGADADPLSPAAAADVGEALCVSGRTEEGLAQLQRVAGLRPPLGRLPLYVAVCHAMQNDWAAVLHDISPTHQSWAPTLYGYALARSGAVAEARKHLAGALEHAERTGMDALAPALLATALGDRDMAFKWLARAADDGSMNGVVMYPFFRELHVDPRFEPFRKRFGFQKR